MYNLNNVHISTSTLSKKKTRKNIFANQIKKSLTKKITNQIYHYHKLDFYFLKQTGFCYLSIVTGQQHEFATEAFHL